MPSASKREQIVTTALQLFYQNGITATGIDLIISEAAVSKKTLYNHFHSKDELVLAVLRKRDEYFRNNLMRETEKQADTPKAKLIALFDVMDAWFHEKTFCGCMFINASGELFDSKSPSRSVCAEHKHLICDYVSELAKEAGAKEPKKLAKQLNILIEGAIVFAHVAGDKEAAQDAKEMGKVFINMALE